VIRHTLIRLAEFGLYTKRAETLLTRNLDWAVVFTARYARRNRKTVHLGGEIAQTVKCRCRATWQPRAWYTRGRKQVNPLAGSWCSIVQTGKDCQEPAGLR